MVGFQQRDAGSARLAELTGILAGARRPAQRNGRLALQKRTDVSSRAARIWNDLERMRRIRHECGGTTLDWTAHIAYIGAFLPSGTWYLECVV